MTPEERLAILEFEIQEEFGPGTIKIEPKADHWYWRVLGKIVSVVTFGTTDFMGSYHTTIGPLIGTATAWKSYTAGQKYALLLHEREHLRQFKKFGLGSLWLGVFPMFFLYLLLPLPIGLAYFRMRFEKAGYAQTLRAWVQLYGPSTALANREIIVQQFTTAKYGWMWPFRRHMERWVDDVVADCVLEEGM